MEGGSGSDKNAGTVPCSKFLFTQQVILVRIGQMKNLAGFGTPKGSCAFTRSEINK